MSTCGSGSTSWQPCTTCNGTRSEAMPATRRTSGRTGWRTGGSPTSARQIVLDTETTGLNPKLGDRVIELGCVEILSRSISERHFHVYLNPQREVEEGALKLHELTREILADKPRCAAIASAFLDFIHGAEL